MPTSWDDTHVVDGFPGRFVVLARRAGDIWYLGGIAGENAYAATMDFSFLPEAGAYEATLIQDGASDAFISTTQRRVDGGIPFDCDLAGAS